MIISELIKSKGQTDKPCESVLGDETRVHTIANMWEYADLIHIIGVNELIEWTSDKEFNSAELKAFQEGLAALPEFMEKCFKEKDLPSAPQSAG